MYINISTYTCMRIHEHAHVYVSRSQLHIMSRLEIIMGNCPFLSTNNTLCLCTRTPICIDIAGNYTLFLQGHCLYEWRPSTTLGVTACTRKLSWIIKVILLCPGYIGHHQEYSSLVTISYPSPSVYCWSATVYTNLLRCDPLCQTSIHHFLESFLFTLSLTS